ncbi:hypothetical protein GLOTRDRAFT_74533 [Gloeophyllum trabeum ATCC 11539]|uniref:Early meiotic induction protein 1 n=1 Tax=Gloeophyllum trabeum (strain ATCC 11539 / FP-39264 / Madison 617) TaxID=670483 RepID=S7QEA3_GLOTA|nr:uncharacterized protein GLOTRDRAFT_74533 [Gloeophyllum trabeum ATCC 11539]EPQ57628.1 hypothetical protein GLOTRDRAFT_74533 [Gloeophyllum trabeum ATCC 11539]
MSTVDFATAVAQEEAYLQKLHPTPDDIPGCMKIFDDFLSCNITVNQIRSLYRYGQRAECGHKWEDFKFCMSITNLHPEERRNVWIRRRAEWWAHRRLSQSSEDIWEIRKEPLQNWPPATPTCDANAETIA